MMHHIYDKTIFQISVSGKNYKHVVITSNHLQIFMAKLCCVDYGFECEFAVETEDVSELIDKFAKHTTEEHGIEYSEEALMQFMVRKHNSNKFEDAYMHTA